jgi:hypothetical protein
MGIGSTPFQKLAFIAFSCKYGICYSQGTDRIIRIATGIIPEAEIVVSGIVELKA